MADLRNGAADGPTPSAADDDPASPFLGPNAWLVEEMYEQFVADPASVSESWQEFFADYHSQAPSVAAAAATPVATPTIRCLLLPTARTARTGSSASLARRRCRRVAPQSSPPSPPPSSPPDCPKIFLRRSLLSIDCLA